MGNNLLSRPPVEKQTTGWVRKLKQLTVFLLLLITGFVSKAQFSVANIDGNPIEWSITNVNSIPIHAYTLDKFGSGVVDDQFSTGTKDFFTAPGTCNIILV
ncbi:MAG: hypothetical protein HYX40_10305 [Sphingobacteriales bacterium]|nr:hypothetical protein [Sphingobacteriales bacterium]